MKHDWKKNIGGLSLEIHDLYVCSRCGARVLSDPRYTPDQTLRMLNNMNHISYYGGFLHMQEKNSDKVSEDCDKAVIELVHES